MSIGSTAMTSDQEYVETASDPSRPNATVAATSNKRISMPSTSALRIGAPVDARIADRARLLTPKNVAAANAAATSTRGDASVNDPAMAWNTRSDMPTPVSTWPKLNTDLNHGRRRTNRATTIAPANATT